jgi:RND superfamily putative drug exporter
VLGSITVLPALLSRLGHWVDRPRLPLLWRLNRRIGRGGISKHVVGPVVRHPKAALVAGGALVAALAAPALGMTVHESNLKTLPADIPQVQTFRTMSAEFPSQGAHASVVVKARAADADVVRDALDDLQATALGTGDFVDGLTDPVQVSADRTVTVLRLVMPYDESDERVDGAIERLRDDLVPPALAGTPSLGAEHAVGGSAAESYDNAHHLRSFLPVVVGFVLLLTMLMMGLAFRSVVIAGVSAVLNLASVGVAFGLLTLVFQHGWFEGALDFSSPGFIIDWLPMFILVVLVGLSMDYHVFVLGRVREHVRNGLPARLAVERGVTDTAGVVTSAAAVMVSVFAIFATLSMLEMKMMGVGLSAAILLDATVIRLVLSAGDPHPARRPRLGTRHPAPGGRAGRRERPGIPAGRVAAREAWATESRVADAARDSSRGRDACDQDNKRAY